MSITLSLHKQFNNQRHIQTLGDATCKRLNDDTSNIQLFRNQGPPLSY